MKKPASSHRVDDVLDVIRAIPRGRVATYGQIADWAGLGAGHRFVARVVRDCPKDVPWQRVLAKKDARRAKIALLDPDHAALQRARLRREGVRFDDAGFVSLAEFGFRPR